MDPLTVNYGDDSYAAGLIKNSGQFKETVASIITDHKGETQINTNTDDAFESGVTTADSDLFYAIHNYKLAISGKKNNDGTWRFNATVSDTFDFTEFKTPLDEKWRKNPLAWTGNDLAYLRKSWIY